ncbi:hypothetical protein [Marivivens aquimaris]|uniref:hypothetical protein n=1 Tax=Marivivens aquimaris TaxID=2774876 RepID=UPI00187F4EC0|nr:hypothetical protein [Marivivens aquimaris]
MRTFDRFLFIAYMFGYGCFLGAGHVYRDLDFFNVAGTLLIGFATLYGLMLNRRAVVGEEDTTPTNQSRLIILQFVLIAIGTATLVIPPLVYG